MACVCGDTTSSNYLHITAKAGGTASNKIAAQNWLLDADKLQAGPDLWNLTNPTKPATV